MNIRVSKIQNDIKSIIIWFHVFRSKTIYPTNIRPTWNDIAVTRLTDMWPTDCLIDAAMATVDSTFHWLLT